MTDRPRQDGEPMTIIPVSRSDALALHGVGKNLFGDVPGVTESTDFAEMAAAMRRALDESSNESTLSVSTRTRLAEFVRDHHVN